MVQICTIGPITRVQICTHVGRGIGHQCQHHGHHDDHHEVDVVMAHSPHLS
jgi:hypothetical protein